MVLSPPKQRIHSKVVVLHDGGEESWSLAIFQFDEAYRLGTRWNGSFSWGESNVGTPQSRGRAAWFILPDPISEYILKDKRYLDKLEENDLTEADKKRIPRWIESILESAEIEKRIEGVSENDGTGEVE